MKVHLFYAFLAIFAATSIITLLGVTNVIPIREGYLTALVGAFLIELAGAVIAIFKSANFFASESNQIPAEESIRNSIRKLDTAFGYLEDSLKAQSIHFQSRILASTHLPPTPRTDVMVLAAQIERSVGKVSPDAINEALGTIADLLEHKVNIGSGEKATLVSLCRT
ncbi:MAG: hypothetical protein ACRD2L_15505, partial [Terriglobia bacterium]